MTLKHQKSTVIGNSPTKYIVTGIRSLVELYIYAGINNIKKIQNLGQQKKSGKKSIKEPSVEDQLESLKQKFEELTKNVSEQKLSFEQTLKSMHLLIKQMQANKIDPTKAKSTKSN